MDNKHCASASNIGNSFLDETYKFKLFDSAKDPLDHHYYGASKQKDVPKELTKKVFEEWEILRQNLPDGIFVRVYEDQIDLFRAVIVGPYGTPYQDGLFCFDLHLPSRYPAVPPSVYYHSGRLQINPNLYEDGSVCLSLLNTWLGDGNEAWVPASSSLLQVLVSLQGLVLNSKPYFNEFGYDVFVGTVHGETESLAYNEETFILNCKTMIYLMSQPPKGFEDFIKEHFRMRGYYILKACDAYVKGYLVGSLTKNALVNDEGAANSNSERFRRSLSEMVPKLLCAFTALDVDCREYKEFPYSDEFPHLQP